MNRCVSTLAILALGLLAIAISIRQIIEAGGIDGASILLVLLSIAALGVIAAAGWLLWQRYASNAAANLLRSGILQPLRRLLSTVWS